MKKIIGISLFLFFGLASVSQAQDKDRTKETRKEVKKAAKKTGNKTAELASKGKAKVVDAEVKDKMGPNGETVYINNDNRYYWVDKKGKKHYLGYGQLRKKEL